MDNSQRVEGGKTHMAEKSLRGDSETMGHRGYLANRHLPEVVLFTILNSN